MKAYVCSLFAITPELEEIFNVIEIERVFLTELEAEVYCDERNKVFVEGFVVMYDEVEMGRSFSVN